MTAEAAILVAQGTVDDLRELPEFTTRIRRGHPPPPELIAELTRRYEAIGGQSPLNAINRRLAARVENALGKPTRVANRLARPFVKDVLAELAKTGIRKVAAVPLAQYSAHVYAEAAAAAASELARDDVRVEVASASSWGSDAELLDAYADAITSSLDALPEAARTSLVLSAHSLPLSVIQAGDPYEAEFRAAAKGVTERVLARAKGKDVHPVVAFQSQGMSRGPGGKPVEWLGPDLIATIDACQDRGDTHVLFAPIGFLADHVEILYDLDIEACAWVEARGMRYHRTPSLNDSERLARILARLAGPLLEGPHPVDASS
jgi:ferrochelatase